MRKVTEDNNSVEKLQDEIYILNLEQLRNLFKSADKTNTDALDLAEFVEGFRNALGKERTKQELEQLFHSIDANANGEIDWMEFYTFLFLEREGKRKMEEDFRSRKFLPIKKLTTSKNQQHESPIQKIIYDEKLDEFYTKSVGSVKVWSGKKSENYHFLSTIHKQKVPITDIEVRKDTNRLYISDLQRRVHIYNIKTGKLQKIIKGRLECFKSKHGGKSVWQNKFEMVNATGGRNAFLSSGSLVGRKKRARIRKFKMKYSKNKVVKEKVPIQFIEKLTENPMVMKVFNFGDENDKELMLLGLDDGNIKIYDCSIHYNEFKEEIVVPPIEHITQINPMHRFNGWISSVEMFHQYRGLFATSLDGRIKLFQMRNDALHFLREFGGKNRLNVSKPIYSLSYDPKLNLLASCGRTKYLTLWNPMIEDSITKLYHRTPIIDVKFDANSNLIFSLGQNNVINIWDTRTYKKLQTIKSKNSGNNGKMNKINFSGIEKNYSSLISCQENLIVCTTGISRAFTMRKNLISFDFRVYTGTNYKVKGVLYCAMTNSVITCDKENIFTWDLKTGKIVFKFCLNKTISFIKWDNTGRRLLVCLDNNEIRGYNFLNGQLLRIYINTPPKFINGKKNLDYEKLEISAVTHVNNEVRGLSFMATGGWEKRIIVYNDTMEEVLKEKHSKKFKLLHSDILSLIFVKPSFIIAGHLDGSISIIEAQTGNTKLVSKIKKRKNAFFPEDENLESQRSKVSISTGVDFEGTKFIPLQIEKLLWRPALKNIFISLRGNGVISFWLINNCQHLFDLYQQTQVVTMTLSDDGKTLVTGDSEGSVVVYDLTLITKTHLMEMVKRNFVKDVIKIKVSPKKITHVCYVDELEIIVTGSNDCVCTVVTRDGKLVGYLGQDLEWDLKDEKTFQKRKYLELRKESFW